MEQRTYRNTMKAQDLVFFSCVYKETDLYIGAKKDLSDECLSAVRKLRLELEGYIKLNPMFAESLEPIPPDINAPKTARLMIRAAHSCGVGPMAGVAGAFSYMLYREIAEASDEVIIENGGDLLIKTNKERKINLYSGQNSLAGKLNLIIDGNSEPLGICTSSGKFGHSLSFGKADAACIISSDVVLADAAATATGNRVKTAADISSALAFASGIRGIKGAVVVCDEKVGIWGDVKLG